MMLKNAVIRLLIKLERVALQVNCSPQFGIVVIDRVCVLDEECAYWQLQRGVECLVCMPKSEKGWAWIADVSDVT